jgi:radical SAM superfamily enzyme YgiQ (UPF0313 family)
MKIQLFNPPVFHYAGFHYRMMPPLGLPTIAAVLNNAGHHAETVDLEALQVTPSMLRDAFIKQKGNWPDVVGITCLTVTQQGAQESIKALREAGFEGRIMVGGVHITMAPEDGIAWGADLVVTGECEGNIVSLLETGAKGIQAGERMAIEDIPAPDWDHHNPEPRTYWGNMALMRPNPGITMWTRGCPFSCIFCSNLVFGGQPTRYRPPENIEAEMKALKRHGCQNIYVYDDELVGTRMPEGWMKDVADRIEPMGFSWVTQGRCNKHWVTEELLRDVKRAGCRAIFWGVESFSEKVLKAIKKHTSVEDIWHTLRVARDAGIENGVFTMIGNYMETEDDLEITRAALEQAYKEGLIQYRQTTYCTAMPGTEYAEIQKREGWYQAPPGGGRRMMEDHYATPLLTHKQIDEWMLKFEQACPVRIPV